jgi:hypothetical protein
MIEINNVSVIRRRIDFTLVAVEAGKKSRVPKIETPERATMQAKRRAAREIDRAQLRHAERGAHPRKGGGKLQLGVSHRKGGAKPHKKRR